MMALYPARSVSVVGPIFFPVTGEEIDATLLRVQHLDQGAGQILLVGRGHTFLASHVLDDNRAVCLNLVFLCRNRLLVGIDVLDVHLLGLILVFVQARLERADVLRLLEDDELDWRLEVPQQLDRLI